MHNIQTASVLLYCEVVYVWMQVYAKYACFSWGCACQEKYWTKKTLHVAMKWHVILVLD